MSGNAQTLVRDDSGSVLLEFTLSMGTFLVILFGIVEFSFGMYQYNAASKSVEMGARIASVSDPIPTNLQSGTLGVSNSVQPGKPMPTFDLTCATSNGTVSCDGTAGPVAATYSAQALNNIVFGLGNTSCQTAPATPGMCNIFPRVTRDNVVVRYQYTGLGYAGRPGGAVPTITVSLRNLQFQFFFLGGLMSAMGGSISNAIDMPTFATTVTGEDLSVAPPP